MCLCRLIFHKHIKCVPGHVPVHQVFQLSSLEDVDVAWLNFMLYFSYHNSNEKIDEPPSPIPLDLTFTESSPLKRFGACRKCAQRMRGAGMEHRPYTVTPANQARTVGSPFAWAQMHRKAT